MRGTLIPSMFSCINYYMNNLLARCIYAFIIFFSASSMKSTIARYNRTKEENIQEVNPVTSQVKVCMQLHIYFFFVPYLISYIYILNSNFTCEIMDSLWYKIVLMKLHHLLIIEIHMLLCLYICCFCGCAPS